MDECGNTGNAVDPNQPIHFLGCLIVEDTSVRPLEDSLIQLAGAHFPEKFREERFEFHGSDLFAGKGYFAGETPETRITVARSLIGLANEHASAFGYVGVDKTKSYANDHPHRICFTLLAERLEFWLRAKDSIALLVSDENHEVEQTIIRDIRTFKENSTQWGYKQLPITRVIDSVHFVKSHNNPIIQVADVITFLIQKDKVVMDRLLDKWISLPTEQRGRWKDFQENNLSKAEAATRALVAELNFPFSSKIWP